MRNAVAGIPSSNMAFWNTCAAGCWFGSSSSSTPSGPSGEATVTKRNSPMGMSCLISKPRMSV